MFALNSSYERLWRKPEYWCIDYNEKGGVSRCGGVINPEYLSTVVVPRESAMDTDHEQSTASPRTDAHN